MKKTFNFGKHAVNNPKIKNNLIEIKIELKEEKNGIVFTACGAVWNSKHSDIIMCGQCLDELIPYLKNNKTFLNIYEMWKRHHLNDMHAGTKEQEEALKKAVADGKLKKYGANNYEETCNYLKSINLYEVEYKGQTYKYGHGWIYYPIPDDDLKIIKNLLDEE